MSHAASPCYSSPSFSPKSLKFSHLQKLKAAPLLPGKFVDDPGADMMRKEVRGTLAKVERGKEKEEFFNDADVKISRHQFAGTVVAMREMINNFHSVGVFVEHMLQDLRNRDESDVATIAAAGTWALNLLAHQEVGGALQAISEALLPAIYCEFNPRELPYASAAIQVQLRDHETIKHNPYFTHSMYVEQVRVDHQHVADIHKALHCALKNNEGGRNYVLRNIQEKLKRNIQYHFNAWRQITRRHRILDMTTEKRMQRHNEANSNLRLRLAFAAWKLMVESARATFLTDRLNEVAFQLENAKNQFQLQCFRTDRLIQTTKEAKAELSAALTVEETLRDMIGRLEAELIAREEAYNGRLTSHIKEAFLLVTKYREILTVLFKIRLPVEPYLLLHEDYEAPTFTHLTAEIEMVEEDPVETLVQWCNFAAKEVMMGNYKSFNTIGPDFYSGELYLIVLYFVFPHSVSLQPNKDSNIGYRLRRICEMCEECRLIHTLVPDDFLTVREDRMVASLSEMYRRYLSKKWQENARSAAVEVSVVLDPSNKEKEQENIEKVDEEIFHNFMEECNQDLETKEQTLIEQAVSEKTLTDHAHLIGNEEVHLCKERRLGAPIRVLGEATRRNFWKVNYKALLDIRSMLNIGNEAQLKQVVVGSLQMLLKKKDEIISRIFYFFAGENAKTMSEVAFWRFIETNTFCSESSVLTKEVVGQVLDRVVSPQLEAAMKAATHGKSEMDLKTLMSVAQKEIDIRQIQPSHFVLIILRFAAETYRSQVSFVEGVKRFLELLKIPSIHAYPLLLQQYYSTDTQHVMSFYCDDLLRIFFFYLKQQEQSKVARDRLIATQDGGRFCALFSLRSYIAMFEDCSFIDNGEMDSESVESDEKSIAAATRLNFATEKQVESCIVKLKASRTSIAATEVTLPGANAEMTFTVFLESFGIFCQYWCPDPFVPLPRKIAAFVACLIKRLMRMHAASTLILGTPPNISLDGGPKVNMALSSA